jgi:hypothetical protein
MDLRKLGGRTPKSPVYRFNNSFVKDEVTGCWNWLGKARSGTCRLYGRITVNKKTMPAHRFSWELHNEKKVPDGMIVMHKCDNPECVNPDHLTIGTTKDNSDDKVRKNRQAKGASFSNRKTSNGSKNGMSKLTETQAKEIFNDKNPQREIASRYGVSQTVVHNIKSLKTWKVIHG